MFKIFKSLCINTNWHRSSASIHIWTSDFALYLEKNISCINTILLDYPSVSPDISPQNKCRSQCISQSSDLPYILKNICFINIDWLCWGLTTRRPLWVILCRLPEKGRREIVKEMKERDRGERKMNDSEETEEIKTFPLYLYLLQG